MRKFVISDTHFYHTNIIRYCNRPFVDVPEMNRVLVANWNGVVTPEDTVIHVGDFAFGPKENWPVIRKMLNGRIILIRGNHDKDHAYMRGIGMDEVYDNRVITHNGVTIYLNHYPEFGERKADFHLYGHVHNGTPPDQPKWARNMSVEVNGYTPVLLDQIVLEFKAAA